MEQTDVPGTVESPVTRPGSRYGSGRLRNRDGWHAVRVTGWARYGIVLNPVWCAVAQEVPPGSVTRRRLRRYARQGRRIVLAVSGENMVYRFSYGHPDRAKRGERNGCFLDPSTAGQLARLLGPPGGLVEVVVMRIRRIAPNEGVGWKQFVGMLTPWLDALPAGYRYVLENDNPEYVVPEYLECLRARNVGHLLRHDADRSLLDRIQEPGILTAGAVVVRREPEDAVPPLPGWRRHRGGDEEWKLGVIATVRRCVELGITLYVSVPQEETVLMEETVALMDGDLARLSPFRKRLVA